MSTAFIELRLRKGEDRRLRAGHLWIYSNEIDVKQTPLSGFETGALVNVTDHRGAVLGCGYINPHSLIAVRLLSRRQNQQPDRQWLSKRLQRALELREMVFDVPYYRLVYGESDGLPGLVVDRFASTLVMQVTTAGMERLQTDVVEVLQTMLKPTVIVLRNDSPAREYEGLDSYVKTVFGEPPDTLYVEENGGRFEVPLSGSQKTGWFYDHRSNRARMQAYAANKRVLDVFSYAGGWGIEALTAGAANALCVDSSTAALHAAEHNAGLNDVADRCATHHGDAFEVLKELHHDKQKFDLVVLDPPAFVKRRKDLQQGAQAYRRLNALAMNLLTSNGVLVSASCSYHLPRERLMSEIRQAASKSGRIVQIIEQGHQAPDHPVHPAMPETDYLKAFICRIV
jgi:23S rRNA (cytosine1962-C5)-methyltransferase